MYQKRVGRQTLRQGDIIKGIVHGKPTCSPAMLCDVSSASSISKKTYKHSETNKTWTAMYPAVTGSGLCVVLSQCCELDLHDGACKATNILLSPLQEITPGYLKKDQVRFERIKQNIPDTDASAYWFEAVPKSCNNPLLGEFSNIFSVPGGSYTWLLGGKVAQLSDVERVKFKTKLALFLGRPTKEEEDAGLWPEEA